MCLACMQPLSDGMRSPCSVIDCVLNFAISLNGTGLCLLAVLLLGPESIISSYNYESVSSVVEVCVF